MTYSTGDLIKWQSQSWTVMGTTDTRAERYVLDADVSDSGSLTRYVSRVDVEAGAELLVEANTG